MLVGLVDDVVVLVDVEHDLRAINEAKRERMNEIYVGQGNQEILQHYREGSSV